jgi:hypothetical protein
MCVRFIKDKAVKNNFSTNITMYFFFNVDKLYAACIKFR